MRGSGVFKINETTIDMDKFNNELILSSNQINNIEILNIKKNVITVENLTTYNDIETKNNLVIYLGGFHNTIKSKLLKKIYNYNKNLKFIHIGDIDAGGFYILNHLIEDTGIKFFKANYKESDKEVVEYVILDILKSYELYYEWIKEYENNNVDYRKSLQEEYKEIKEKLK